MKKGEPQSVYELEKRGIEWWKDPKYSELDANIRYVTFTPNFYDIKKIVSGEIKKYREYTIILAGKKEVMRYDGRLSDARIELLKYEDMQRRKGRPPKYKVVRYREKYEGTNRINFERNRQKETYASRIMRFISILDQLGKHNMFSIKVGFPEEMEDEMHLSYNGDEISIDDLMTALLYRHYDPLLPIRSRVFRQDAGRAIAKVIIDRVKKASASGSGRLRIKEYLKPVANKIVDTVRDYIVGRKKYHIKTDESWPRKDPLDHNTIRNRRWKFFNAEVEPLYQGVHGINEPLDETGNLAEMVTYHIDSYHSDNIDVKKLYSTKNFSPHAMEIKRSIWRKESKKIKKAETNIERQVRTVRAAWEKYKLYNGKDPEMKSKLYKTWEKEVGKLDLMQNKVMEATLDPGRLSEAQKGQKKFANVSKIRKARSLIAEYGAAFKGLSEEATKFYAKRNAILNGVFSDEEKKSLLSPLQKSFNKKLTSSKDTLSKILYKDVDEDEFKKLFRAYIMAEKIVNAAATVEDGSRREREANKTADTSSLFDDVVSKINGGR